MKKLYLSIQAFFCFFIAFLGADFDPIAIYLTWQHDPLTTMTIQWITPPNRSNDTIYYKREGQNEWQSAVGKHSMLPNGARYTLHLVELESLRPGTDYLFRPGADGVTFKFRTMPSDLKTPIRFVVGGDMYRDDIKTVSEMSRRAASTDPLFALVGGDIAYTIASPSSFTMGFFHRLFSAEKFDRWLDWLISWKNNMVTTDGRLIPVLPAIGNHETLGFDDQSPDQAKFFYALFPMPGKQGYNVLDFSDYLSIFILDSGHTHYIHGDQTKWLGQTLQRRQSVPNKFAVYHVGAYPSVRNNGDRASKSIRNFWSPLFEQYGLTAAFEHHDHAYKRTHPLRNGHIDPNGVMYLGDGCWGTAPRVPKTPRELWYLAKSASSRHVIVVTIDKQDCHFMAIDPWGNVIDECTR